LDEIPVSNLKNKIKVYDNGIVYINCLTISATLREGVVRNDWGFREGQTIVFRRFTGY